MQKKSNFLITLILLCLSTPLFGQFDILDAEGGVGRNLDPLNPDEWDDATRAQITGEPPSKVIPAPFVSSCGALFMIRI